MYSLAAIEAFSRLTLSDHFLSDTFFGGWNDTPSPASSCCASEFYTVGDAQDEAVWMYRSPGLAKLSRAR